MKKIRNYAIVPVLALVAFFMIAARSAEPTSAATSAQPSVTAPAMQAGPSASLDITAATSAEATAAVVTDLSKLPVQGGDKMSLKEKIAAKIIAKQMKKEMRKDEVSKTNGGKSQLVALLLCLFIGYLGIHRFYLGYTGLGVLMLLTGGVCGILTLIDFIRICIGDLKPKGGDYETTL